MAKRTEKPRPVKSPSTAVSVLPIQLEPGDTFTDEAGAWEVVGRPTTQRGEKQVKVNVQRPGDTGTRREQWWPAHERLTVKRAAS